MKYKDLPMELKQLISFGWRHIPRSGNPTVKYIMKSLKVKIKGANDNGWYVTSKELNHLLNEVTTYVNNSERMV